MYCVEAFSLAQREVRLAHGSDSKSLFFKAGYDLTDVVVFDGVGLDDRKGALHGVLLWVELARGLTRLSQLRHSNPQASPA
jgi:hypothetical protein